MAERGNRERGRQRKAATLSSAVSPHAYIIFLSSGKPHQDVTRAQQQARVVLEKN